MAKATVTCTCSKCGAKFEVSTYKANRREADSWAEYIESQEELLCKECYIESKKEAETKRAQDFVEEFEMPEIVGVSEKQTAYAVSLRNRYLSNHGNDIRFIRNELAKVAKEKIEELAASEGKTVEDIIYECYAGYEIGETYKLYTLTKASEIIDLLK